MGSLYYTATRISRVVPKNAQQTLDRTSWSQTWEVLRLFLPRHTEGQERKHRKCGTEGCVYTAPCLVVPGTGVSLHNATASPNGPPSLRGQFHWMVFRSILGCPLCPRRLPPDPLTGGWKRSKVRYPLPALPLCWALSGSDCVSPHMACNPSFTATVSPL